ncbi:hypothetical protein ES703_37568 [subsurface metagenome]
MIEKPAYLSAFAPKIIREARRMLQHGVTVEDIDEYLTSPESHVKPEPYKGCGGKKDIPKGIIGLAKAEFGIDRASEELIAERKAVCMSCDLNDIGRCFKCNCYLYAKIRIRKEKCPENKWREDNGST